MSERKVNNVPEIPMKESNSYLKDTFPVCAPSRVH